MNFPFSNYIGLYIFLASVTLCRLGGPSDFISRPAPIRGDGGALPNHERMGSHPLLTDPPADGATVSSAVSLSILGSKHGGRHAPVNVGGRAGPVLQLIVAGDPLDLTGLEVRAHSKREAGHRSVG